ncbi:MAG: energy-coupling factor ABC transporter ATP-binding protein [Anaeromyxobacteraceae bacterium]
MTPALTIEASQLGPAAGRWALGPVRLALRPGERVAILGANGAGKTTLLRAAMGLARVRDGEVRMGGKPIRTPEEAVRAGAGLVLQNPEDQLLGTTVLDDVMIGPLHAGIGVSAARERAAGALATVGLAGMDARRVDELSFGEKRRVGLAAVLAMEPSLLLLDEPTSGLDPVGEMEFVALLSLIARERGTTLVVATHAVDLVPAVAGRAVVLGEGRILSDGPVAELFADAALLARARLRAPWVTQLWSSLGHPTRDGRSPLTLQEAVAWNADRS